MGVQEALAQRQAADGALHVAARRARPRAARRRGALAVGRVQDALAGSAVLAGPTPAPSALGRRPYARIASGNQANPCCSVDNEAPKRRPKQTPPCVCNGACQAGSSHTCQHEGDSSGCAL